MSSKMEESISELISVWGSWKGVQAARIVRQWDRAYQVGLGIWFALGLGLDFRLGLCSCAGRIRSLRSESRDLNSQDQSSKHKSQSPPTLHRHSSTAWQNLSATRVPSEGAALNNSL